MAPMTRRRLGRTGLEVSEIGFGGWAIGGGWGATNEADAIAALHTALDHGVNFFDTADVYGDGLSERRIAAVRKARPESEMIIATKAGGRLGPRAAEAYTPANLERWVDRSLENLEVESLDLLQLHCPPTEVYYRPEVFDALDDMVARARIRHYGVSVEKVEEALKAIEYPSVETVQVIFNVFRQRPAELLFREAAAREVGIIARVPLASGLLTGTMSLATAFDVGDHRNFNRDGSAFDIGETFSGVEFATGLTAVEALRPLVPPGATMAQLALRWILMFGAVSTVIAGARNPDQAQGNADASSLAPLSEDTMTAIDQVYRKSIAPGVHHRW